MEHILIQTCALWCTRKIIILYIIICIVCDFLRSILFRYNYCVAFVVIPVHVRRTSQSSTSSVGQCPYHAVHMYIVIAIVVIIKIHHNYNCNIYLTLSVARARNCHFYIYPAKKQPVSCRSCVECGIQPLAL